MAQARLTRSQPPAPKLQQDKGHSLVDLKRADIVVCLAALATDQLPSSFASEPGFLAVTNRNWSCQLDNEPKLCRRLVDS
jgi:hypothetical protein